MIRHLINYLLNFLPPTGCFSLRRLLMRMGGVNVSAGVSYCGHGWIYGRGKLTIDRDTWLSPRCIFYTHSDAEIHIAPNCDIGHGVIFITGSHEIGSDTRRAGKGKAMPIFVEAGCWIGAGSTILGGSRIGRGSIVAAGSVVTKDVMSNSLAAGVPAAQKRRLE
jgi:maltose O-acetyltransferase